MKKFYNVDGVSYPLTEAKHDMMFKVYRSDRRKALRGSALECLLAKGVLRHKHVKAVFIGSGKDAYVVFKETAEEPAHAVHFIIGTPVRRVIDGFDKDRKAQSQEIILRRPADSLTLEHRRQSNARRAAEVKAGASRTKRERRAANRITRLGVPHRPRAPISRGGSVDVSASA